MSADVIPLAPYIARQAPAEQCPRAPVRFLAMPGAVLLQVTDGAGDMVELAFDAGDAGDAEGLLDDLTAAIAVARELGR